MGLNEIIYGMAAATALAAALAVVSTRNTVYAALFFVTHLLALAGVYASLNAPLLAVMQVMVYAGAVMVLFTFAIMILDVPSLENAARHFGRRLPWLVLVAVTLLAALMLVITIAPADFMLAKVMLPEMAAGEQSIRTLARMLFARYLLAFEMVGVLLLVAVVGVVVMAKRRLEN